MLRLLYVASLVLTVHSQLTLDDVGRLDQPVVGGVLGRYISSPGLEFQPRLDENSNLVRYTKYGSSSITPLVDILQRELAVYQNSRLPSDVMDCSMFPGYRAREYWSSPCRFDLVELGAECVVQQQFGYPDGQPCILLKMTRLYNWLPELYTNETIPEVARGNFADYHVTVTCEGADAPSRDNLGPVTFYPRNGFHVRYFPDVGAPGYLPPLVFARFEAPLPAVLINVECRVWAMDLRQASYLHTGLVSIALLVD